MNARHESTDAPTWVRRLTRLADRHGAGMSGSRFLAAVGGLAAILTIVGISGVGDAPAPLDEARLMAEHLQAVRDEVFSRSESNRS